MDEFSHPLPQVVLTCSGIRCTISGIY